MIGHFKLTWNLSDNCHASSRVFQPSVRFGDVDIGKGRASDVIFGFLLKIS